MKRPFLFCIVFMIFASFSCCKGGKNSIGINDKDLITITVHERSIDETINIADIVDSVSYISLETIRESLIGRRILKVFFIDNMALVVSGNITGQEILFFDKSGKYLRKISKKGRGLGEYISLDIAMLDDMDKRVIVYDSHNKKLLFYDFEGRFIKEISDFAAGYYPGDITNLPNGNFLCYRPNHGKNDQYSGDVWEVDQKGAFKRWVVPTDFIHPTIAADYYFYPLLNGGTGFHSSETESLYYYENEGMVEYCTYIFDGKTVKDFEGIYNENYGEHFMKGEKFVAGYYISDNYNYIFSNWYDDTGEKFYTLYNRSNSTLKTARKIAENLSPKIIIDNEYSWGGMEFVLSNDPNVIVAPVRHELFYNTDTELENPVLQILHLKKPRP